MLPLKEVPGSRPRNGLGRLAVRKLMTAGSRTGLVDRYCLGTALMSIARRRSSFVTPTGRS
ncbi:MAG: hypothetical protein DMF81_13245 [Acidobacteria bacterium]|nr:MAG: hypothetical protein DMF81_13245 [Acidobacteriota bacterium]